MRFHGFAAAAALLAMLACNNADHAAPSGAIASAAASPKPAATSAKPVVQVWKDPTCGCCTGWVEHLKAAGYPVEVMDVADVAAIAREKGIPANLTACHTALVDGYLVEGHVPVEVIDRLLAERPQVAGVAVPGMPMGSEGMEMPGGQADHYDVVAFKANGESTLYERR